MPRPSLSRHPATREDIKAIVKYIARDNPEAARRVSTAVRAAIRELVDDPLKGSPWAHRTNHPDLKDVRCVLALPFRQFLIFYRFEGQEIRILYITRGAQDIDGLHGSARRA